MKNKIAFLALVIFFGINNIIKAQTPSYIPTNHLKLWMPFEGNANDQSNNGNNGIVVNSALTTDRFNNANCAYSFNGSTSHIKVNHNFFNIGWDSWTISCWMNSNSVNNSSNANNNQCLYNTIPLNGFALDFNWGSSNKYALWANTNPATSNWNVLFNNKSNSSISINTWNHMVVVKKGTNYYLYINGVLDKTYINSVVVPSYFAKFSIGSTDSTVTQETFKGKLDDFGIWDTVLTVTQINTIYSGTSTGIKENNFVFENMSLFPSPTNGKDVNLVFTSKIKEKAIIQVIDNLGNLVFEDSKNIFAGKNDFQFNVENLTAGFYYLKVSAGNYTQNIKFIKE